MDIKQFCLEVKVDNSTVKLYAYFWMPVFIALVSWIGFLTPTSWMFSIILLIPFVLFEFLLLSSIREFPKEVNRDTENTELLQHLSQVGYAEVSDKAFEVKLTGFHQEPVNVRTSTGIHAVMKEGCREGVPNRFIFFTVGSGQNYLLVGDRLDEKYRLFCK